MVSDKIKHIRSALFDFLEKSFLYRVAFHSARTRMDNIQKQFPELANIDERIWHEVYQETQFYHLTATYILLDLQQSYEVCWRLLKNCFFLKKLLFWS